MDINFEELQDEEEFFEKILRMDNEDDILKEFEKHGKKISHEELMELKKSVNKVVKKLDTLSEDQLSEICGGDVIDFLVPGPVRDFARKGLKGISRLCFWAAKKADPNICESVSQNNSGNFLVSLGQLIGVPVSCLVDFVVGKKVSSIDSQTASYKLKEEKANKMAVAAGTVAVVSIMVTLIRYRKDLMKWWCSGE